MNCDVGEATEGLENEIKRRKGWRMSCDVAEVTERWVNEQSYGLWPQTARRSSHLLQEFGWEVFIHNPPYSSDLAPSVLTPQ